MALPTWLRRWVGNRAARVTPIRRFRPALDLLEGRDVPAVVGYYDATFFEGVPSQVAPIVAAGHTPVKLYDLTAADLAGLDVLFVQNDFNNAYGVEYVSRLAPIQSAVAAGMTLVLHDRYVDGAESVLPGGAGFNVVRDFTDPDNVQVLDDSTLVTHGPGGAVTNTTLDNGGSSSHGFAFAASLPAGARAILGTGAAGHVVTFSYQFGSGHVVYSSIPLDHYLANQPNGAFAQVYAPNVVAYAVDIRNAPPVAGSGTATGDEDGTVGGQLPGSDPDGDPLTYTIVAAPQHGTISVDQATGQYLYTPDPDFFGTDSFSYSAADGAGATATGTITITINSVNDDPVAAADAATTAEDTPVAVPVLGNDADVEGQALAVVAVTPGAHGSVTIGDGGVVTYTPVANFHGTDSFTYTVSDGHGGAATATVTVTVAPVNDAPVAADASATAAEDTLVAIFPAYSDVDGDALVLAVDPAGHGTVAVGDGGAVTYTPVANFHGTDSFTYTVSDGHGGTATGTVTVTVTPVNDAPTANAGQDTSADEGTSVSFAATAADVDGDTLSYLWDFGDGFTAAGPTASHAYADDGVYTAVLTVTDGHGGVTTDVRAVTVLNVAPVVAAGPDVTIDEGGTFAASGAFTDPGADSWAATVDYGDGSGVQPLTLNADKTFALGHTYADAGTYTVTVRVSDGDGGVGTGTLTVTVRDVSLGVDAGPDRTATEGDTVVLTGTSTNAGTASWVVRNPAGSVVATGTGTSVTFVPADNGVYTATFTVTDGTRSASDSVRVTVANAPPAVALAGPATSKPGGTVTFTAAVADPGTADTHTVTWKVIDDRGRVVATGTGCRISFNPNGPGKYIVTCTVTDDDGGVATATACVTVVPTGHLDTVASALSTGKSGKGPGR